MAENWRYIYAESSSFIFPFFSSFFSPTSSRHSLDTLWTFKPFLRIQCYSDLWCLPIQNFTLTQFQIYINSQTRSVIRNSSIQLPQSIWTCSRALLLENSHHSATSCSRDRLELDCELGTFGYSCSLLKYKSCQSKQRAFIVHVILARVFPFGDFTLSTRA